MMKSFFALTGALALALAFAFAFAFTPLAQVHAAGKPNIVFILADDLGYAEIGANGADHYQTPHIDALAQSGVRFTHCYTAPLCGPSRALILTGRYGFRTGAVTQDGSGEAVHAEWVEPDGTQRQLDFHLPAQSLAPQTRRHRRSSPTDRFERNRWQPSLTPRPLSPYAVHKNDSGIVIPSHARDLQFRRHAQASAYSPPMRNRNPARKLTVSAGYPTTSL